IDADFEAWKVKLLKIIIPVAKGLAEPKPINIKAPCECSKDKGCCDKKKNKNPEEGQGDAQEEVPFESSSDDEDGEDKEGESVLDLEDLGIVMKKLKKAKDDREQEKKASDGPKEMITPLLRKSLSKQGNIFNLYSFKLYPSFPKISA
ncbi:S-adenosyl-L-methionine-dependent tRNA 4-demethylwyosine synthase TYW1-like, partial [Anneissia japonica]|uniref:S-adenosyl-L-methionine-dependent tRNA 4-demethylwyosine synthase TYW1-like n=1 Tax=Anneissia japonica TaxID=1529436 RepID=UPI00142576BC